MRLKTKVEAPELSSRDDAEAAMTRLAQTMNKQRRIAAKRDAEVLAINAKYESPLAECDLSLQSLPASLQAWADENPGQFAKDRKSIQMVSGILGFRTGTPKLALLSRVWNWQSVLNMILTNGLKSLVRTKEEVDKERILSEYAQSNAKEEFALNLRSVGLKVTQDESFYVEPDLTPFEARQTGGES